MLTLKLSISKLWSFIFFGLFYNWYRNRVLVEVAQRRARVALEQNTEKMEMGFKIEIFWWIWLNFRIFFTSKIRLLNNIDLTNFQKTALEKLVY